MILWQLQQEFLEVALRDKMKYLRNAKPRRKATKSSEEAPTLTKKPRPHYPTHQQDVATHHQPAIEPPVGENNASHMRHLKMLQLEERKVSPDRNVISDLMKRTFHYRRLEIIEEPKMVQQLIKVHPSLKRCNQVCTYRVYIIHVLFYALTKPHTSEGINLHDYHDTLFIHNFTITKSTFEFT